ncbi:MAG: mannose-1-phosphate guanylyltransferase, partial [Lachnospiraceae bacterium]|nr:mannose-1-phosphate guanylyltransferase [Lachnospiraceae bacterium]
MQTVLLSGGSGKRLWPLSNGVRSKQFIKVFTCSSGERESMIQRMYRGLKKAAPDAGITVTTLKAQASQLLNQLGDRVDVCAEPVRRDTFPAVMLAALYLRDVKEVSPEEPVIVCPVDPYVTDEYFSKICEMADIVSKTDSNLVLMGIRPTYPSEKYGYIITDGDKVTGFKEKPDLPEAEKLLAAGAWWNGGVFGFKLKYLLDMARERTGFDTFADLKDNYESLEPISFDYAV